MGQQDRQVNVDGKDDFIDMFFDFESIRDGKYGRFSITKLRIDLFPADGKPVHSARYREG